MNYRMTKKQAVQQFRWDWSDFLKSNPHFRGDSIAKRCAFNDYVDGLNKDGFGEVIDEIQDYMKCDFKKDRRDDIFIDINNTGGKY